MNVRKQEGDMKQNDGGNKPNNQQGKPAGKQPSNVGADSAIARMRASVKTKSDKRDPKKKG